jgi:hypothetical protein
MAGAGKFMLRGTVTAYPLTLSGTRSFLPVVTPSAASRAHALIGLTALL